jgi:hypothetical protein
LITYREGIFAKVIKERPNPVLAMVYFAQDVNEKRIEPIRTDFYEYNVNNPLASYVADEINANLYPRAVKELEKQFIMPSNKRVVQSTNPPIVIKDPNGKGRKALLMPSDAPDLMKLLRERGIIPKELAYKQKPQSYLNKRLPTYACQEGQKASTPF